MFRFTVFCFLLTSLCLLTPPLCHGRNVLYTVGVDAYENDWADVRYCLANDAIFFGDNIYSYDSTYWSECTSSVSFFNNTSHTIDYTYGFPTEATVRTTIQNYAATLTAGDLFVFFFSGHGGLTGGTDAFLCCYDDNGRYEDTELAADLSLFANGVTVICIIHSCHSGGMFKGQTATAKWPFAKNVMDYVSSIQQSKGMVAKAPNLAFFTSCDYDESSWGGANFSIFGRYLIEALGHGDTNGDGRLTFYEMYEYVAPRAKADVVAYGHPDDQDAQVFNEALLQTTYAVTNTGATGNDNTNPRITSAGGGSSGCSVATTHAAHWSLFLPWLSLLILSFFSRLVRLYGRYALCQR